MRQYRDVYGYNITGGKADIISVLTGNNHKKIVFLKTADVSINRSGEPIDPWGTPYQISVSYTNGAVIRSAGPNRVFEEIENSDDVSSQ